MKIQIELCASDEDVVVIRCREMTEEIMQLHKVISAQVRGENRLVFYKEQTAYYFDVQDVLFFETEGKTIQAHTRKDVYEVKQKLYELEEMLPATFLRISKSTIVNSKKVYAVTRQLTTANCVEFQDTYKQVYVSRQYYKNFKEKLEEKRI
ncbi:MAG: LytTR family DNA-binding domain-containing protein [Bacilli bacterium]